MGQYLVDLVQGYYFWGYVGFLVGTVLFVRNAGRNDVSFPKAILVMTASIYGGLFGARALFLLQRDPWLQHTDPYQLLVFWEGGLSWLGAPVGGAIACALALVVVRRPLLINLGAMAPAIALAHAISRVGCLFTGCCYGRPTSVPWAIYSDTVQARVHPTQIYSMASELVTVLILQTLFLKPALRKYLAPLYCVLLSASRFFEEFYRGTPAGPELISGLRFYQSVCIVVLAFSLCGLLILWNKKVGTAVSVLVATATVALFVFFRPVPVAVPAETRAEGEPYLVMTRAVFADGLRPWVKLREQQGFRVILKTWDTVPSNEDVRTWIRQNATENCRYALLVGDCSARGENEDALWQMPALALGKDDISDGAYGDINGDGMPELAVGRFPVRTPEELACLVAKVADYEARPLSGNSRQAIIWIGAAGFEEISRRMVSGLRDLTPPWLTPLLITDAGNRMRQPTEFLEAQANPSFMSIVVSHGSYRDLSVGEGEGPGVNLTVEDVARLQGGHPSAPMFLLSCRAGKFDTEDERGRSLGETFCLHPAGPVTVVAATKSTNALVNYLFARAIAVQLTHRPAGLDSAGDLVRLVQCQLAGSGTGLNDPSLMQDETAAQILSAGAAKDGVPPEEPKDLVEDVAAYILLGDPAARLWFP